MDGFELFQLGRRLMKLGEQAMPELEFHRPSAPTRTILFDIADNPGSSISDVTARVHFPQSQVSACVARLRDAGVVETLTDPGDRRRTLVRLTAEALSYAQTRPPAEIDDALAAAINTDDPAEIQRVKEALDALAGLLRPRD
ncbi:MarR family winged helix-turn-helix transcriptional regulator [Actinocorallia populi]|uniref:MarR family winged helix-turn-helix transcriptional regulator n=1 Tax=Actinocorallia populi TaxID=2079200 RepID=UPI000D096747|nr:MarR family transcriptional regulator [Actinocorallia populi]